MANFNKVMLLGNLTRDPELRYLPSQTAVVEFGLAINRKYKGQDGSMKDETCFVDCQAFGKPAETLNKYCKKGNPLFVEGRLKYDSWTKQDGSKASKLRVNVENFQFLGSAPGQGGQRPAAAGVSNDENPPMEEPAPSDIAHTNDDIPF
jgi:single-strand DNA-binding protein